MARQGHYVCHAQEMIQKMANNGDIGITCIDGNTSPTTKFDSQLAVPAILTAAALEP